MNKYCLLLIRAFILMCIILLMRPDGILALTLASDSGQINIFSPENIRKFADYLYCQKDYLRAIEEFEKYLPESPDDTIKFKIALSYKMIGSFKKAEDLFIELSESSLLSDEAKLELFKTRFFSKDYSSLQRLYRDYKAFPKRYNSEIRSLYYLSYLFSKDDLPEENVFLNSFPQINRPQMREFYLRKKYPNYKSPTAAALLSAIIPGAGKFYTKDYGDAVTAFIVNGLLGYLALDNFQSRHTFRAWVFTGLGIAFYGGNIYGSAASAQIYNAGIDFNFSNELRFYLNKNNYLLPDDESFCK
jgi:TM2 domain-containing membrane protein YozV